jgi:hypothetical protein
MKKLILLLALSPFLVAFQCDPEPDPCGNYIEFDKPNLVTVENPQATYVVGDVLWLSSTVNRTQVNPNTGNSIDLFESDDKLSYYIDLRKDSNYNGYYQIYLNENTTVVESGEVNWNNIILTKEGEQFKSKMGIKLLESGIYTINLYNVASYNPDRIGCNFTTYSMVTDFSEMDSNSFIFEVE